MTPTIAADSMTEGVPSNESHIWFYDRQWPADSSFYALGKPGQLRDRGDHVPHEESVGFIIDK
jgi:hypothetical protein